MSKKDELAGIIASELNKQFKEHIFFRNVRKLLSQTVGDRHDRTGFPGVEVQLFHFGTRPVVACVCRQSTANPACRERCSANGMVQAGISVPFT